MGDLPAAENGLTAVPEGPWLKLSAALTECAAGIAMRQDLLVKCAPGAGGGAPGCCIPKLATIELDGAHLGADPRTCEPTRPADRDRYPVLWGLLVHEAAHADHTAWEAPAGSSHAAASAALLLEESRVEAAHLRRRAGDRRWLRAATRALILDDIADAAMTKWDAAQAAGLLLARAEGGTLDEEETAAVAGVVEKVLGRRRLARLRRIWRRAQATGDRDAARMLELGRRWCKALGLPPDLRAPERSAAAPGQPSPLAEAIATSLDVIAARDRAAARAAGQAARDRIGAVARTVFASREVEVPSTSSPLRGSRPPTPAEQAAARRLARALRAAAHRERVMTMATALTPPGRLRMREALAADAQRAAGVVPTAEPFVRIIRRSVSSPPLRLGIACDVSGSMANLAHPVASAAWILARAAAHVPDARSATVVFGESVHAVIYPRAVPTQVREWAASSRTEEFCDAVDALDAVLNLSQPGASRLLVVVSDGRFRTDQRERGRERIALLCRSGCGVLWLALQPDARPIEGARSVTLTSPADAVAAIGQAAARALDATAMRRSR